MNLSASQWQFLEVPFREQTDVSVDIKAAIDTADDHHPDNPSINLHVYRTFVYKSRDILDLATAVVNLPAIHDQRQSRPIKFWLHLTSLSSVSTNPISEEAFGLTSLADPKLQIKALYIFESVLSTHDIDDAVWGAMYHDALRMLCPSLLQHASGSTELPVLNVQGIAMEKAVACMNEVNIAVTLRAAAGFSDVYCLTDRDCA